MLYVKFSPNNASYVKCKSFTRKGPRVKLRVKFLPKKAPMFKGTDNAGTFMSLKWFTMLIIVVGTNLPRSKWSIVIGVQNFRILILHFSYREFHKFRTKTINDNDIFSIEEKKTTF